MFGFRKRETYYRGFLRLSFATSKAVLAELSKGDAAISISALLSAHIHGSSLNGGVDEALAEQLAEHMREGALEIFGNSNSVSLCWSFSFALAKEIWSTPDIEDTVVEFYRRRAVTLPWSLSEHRYYHFTMTALSAIRASIIKDYPKWVPD